MTNSFTASRLGRWCTVAAVTAVGALTLAATANATVYRPTTNLGFQANLIAANANPGFDKIIIPSVGAISPPTNLVITDDLYITSDHKFDSVESERFEGPILSGGSVDIREANFITVNPGVKLIISGIEINFGANFGFSAIENLGQLRLDGVTMVANQGRPVNQPVPTASSIISNSTIIDNTQLGPVINTQGSLSVIHSTITQNFGGGIQAEGPFELRNTVLQNSVGFVQDCYSQPTAESGNFDSDGSCGGAATGNPGLEFLFYYKGPTQTRPLLEGSPLINAADPAFCSPVDQSFQVRPATGCDIGSHENEAVKDTTPPSCSVTATRRGPDQQDVTVSDAQSGVAYDGVFSEEITITNGTVANPFGLGAALPPHPSRPGTRVVTASKTDQLQKTNWSFQLRDWAGNVRTCS